MNFCTAQETFNNIKRQPTERESFANYLTQRIALKGGSQVPTDTAAIVRHQREKSDAEEQLSNEVDMC